MEIKEFCNINNIGFFSALVEDIEQTEYLGVYKFSFLSNADLNLYKRFVEEKACNHFKKACFGLCFLHQSTQSNTSLRLIFTTNKIKKNCKHLFCNSSFNPEYIMNEDYIYNYDDYVHNHFNWNKDKYEKELMPLASNCLNVKKIDKYSYIITDKKEIVANGIYLATINNNNLNFIQKVANDEDDCSIEDLIVELGEPTEKTPYFLAIFDENNFELTC